MVALVLADRVALVIGGDDEAFDKSQKLHAAGAHLTVIAPRVTASFARWIDAQKVPWRARDFVFEDLDDPPWLVFSAVRDDALSEGLSRASERQRFLLCCVDQPAWCSYTNLALARVGAVSLALGSAGAAPMLLKRLRDGLVAGLRGDFEDFSRYVSEVRRQSPRSERRARVTEALEGFGVELKVRLPDGWRARMDALRTPPE